LFFLKNNNCIHKIIVRFLNIFVHTILKLFKVFVIYFITLSYYSGLNKAIFVSSSKSLHFYKKKKKFGSGL